MENSTALSNGKGSNADKVQDSETSLLVSKKADKNYLDDSEGTQKSCLDVVFELLATTASTSSLNSLPESVRLLESQLQAEIYQSDVLQQEVEGLRKSLQNSDAYFLVQQQVPLVRVGPKQMVFNPFPRWHLEPSPSECVR